MAILFSEVGNFRELIDKSLDNTAANMGSYEIDPEMNRPNQLFHSNLHSSKTYVVLFYCFVRC